MSRDEMFVGMGERMKAKLLFLTILLFLTGCFLIWSPTATVKSFIAAAQKGDVDGMTKLFSSAAIQKMGLDKIKENNKSFSETAQKAAASGGSYRMENVQETSIPTGKRVSFFYKNNAGTDSIKLVFDLSKEGSAWKIDNIGGAEQEESTSLETPSPSDSTLLKVPVPAPPLPLSENGNTETKTTTNSKTISGGVLNGKAISLPTPVYPPVAKAAKASGTVVVQVIIDENGNVISAHAVSGHPLLQAASVAAARAAKFSPTKLSGQLVKVTGVITYKFSPE
jgi:TonB family protein